MLRKLKDVAEIRQGLAFRSKVVHEPQGTVLVIQAKDLGDDGRIAPTNAARLSAVRFKPEQKLRFGDILLQARGVTYPVAMVDRDPGEAVAAAPLYVIRTNIDVLYPGFLFQFLANPVTQSLLRNRATGTYVPQLSRAEIRDLEIPVPSRAAQRRFAELAFLLRSERDLANRLLDRRLEVMWALMRQTRHDSRDGDEAPNGRPTEPAKAAIA